MAAAHACFCLFLPMMVGLGMAHSPAAHFIPNYLPMSQRRGGGGGGGNLWFSNRVPLHGVRLGSAQGEGDGGRRGEGPLRGVQAAQTEVSLVCHQSHPLDKGKQPHFNPS